MLCAGTEQPLLVASGEAKRPGYIASHTMGPRDSFPRWRKSAAVKGNSFARQAFLVAGKSAAVDEFGAGTVKSRPQAARPLSPEIPPN